MNFFDELGLEKDDDPSSKYQTKKLKRVPSLEVYIANSIEKGSSPPTDNDLIDDRMNDIRFHDKTVCAYKIRLYRYGYVK